jgi:hypothetical protein
MCLIDKEPSAYCFCPFIVRRNVDADVREEEVTTLQARSLVHGYR